MKRYADRNATASQFLAAIGEAAGRDIAGIFSTFLDQAGVPLVTVNVKCGIEQPILQLSQKRLLPLGSKAPAPQMWQIPICYRHGEANNLRTECSLFTHASDEIQFASPKSCPAWLMLNDGVSGYYRTMYGNGLLSRLLDEGGRHLRPTERIGVIGDAQALFASGDLPAADALALVPMFGNDATRQVVESTVRITANIEPHLVPDKLRSNYTRFVQKVYGAKARELGLTAKSGEDEEVRLLRPLLTALVANQGEDSELIVRARELALQWLDDHRAVHPDIVDTVLTTAARHGNRPLYDRFLTELRKTQAQKDREQILNAMSSFLDPRIVRDNFKLFLSGDIDSREAFGLLFGPLQDRRTRSLPFEFVRTEYDRIVAKLPRAAEMDASALLPFVGRGFCDEEHRGEVEAFFKERTAKVMGGPRMLAQAIELINQCIAVRKTQEAGVAAFLREY
jgi:alanyl aminopeptidase